MQPWALDDSVKELQRRLKLKSLEQLNSSLSLSSSSTSTAAVATKKSGRISGTVASAPFLPTWQLQQLPQERLTAFQREVRSNHTSENHTSHVTRHTSHVTRHTSHVTHHTSHVTHHTSHFTRHTSHVTSHVTSHFIRHTSHVTRHTSQVVEDIEVKKFSNASGGSQNKDHDAELGDGEEVIEGRIARATFKVLQVSHPKPHNMGIIFQRFLAAVFLDLGGWSSFDALQ